MAATSAGSSVYHISRFGSSSAAAPSRVRNSSGRSTTNIVSKAGWPYSGSSACRMKRRDCILPQEEAFFRVQRKQPMRQVGHRESDAILGAMRQVALAGGRPLSYADTASILAAAHYLLRRPDLTDIDCLPAVAPADLVAALKADRELACEAVKYLAIMALVDG